MEFVESTDDGQSFQSTFENDVVSRDVQPLDVHEWLTKVEVTDYVPDGEIRWPKVCTLHGA